VLGRRTKATRDMFRRPIPGNFRITFRRDVLAEALWQYGEDELADAALTLSEDCPSSGPAPGRLAPQE
jgi:hypothetical protein